jgi:uncharacterized protein (DUF1015 family)
MAEIQSLRALHYDLAAVGPLDRLVAPPYDVIDAGQRQSLAAKSPFNVVEIDLPEDVEDPYRHAAELLEQWRMQGAVVQDSEPALWALTQTFTGPDGATRTRHGFFCKVRLTDYGPGLVRPHERTHPAAKEDRLRLMRATRANLSPIFSLYRDPQAEAWSALEPFTATAPWGEVTDDEGTTHRLWRVTDQAAIARAQEALAGVELLIADGHHRYETARVYAEEVGGEGEHRYVLMFLCSLGDQGLTVFPTHRLLTGLKDSPAKQEAIRDVLTRDFEIEEVTPEQLQPNGRGIAFGYMDSFFRKPYRVTLKDPAIADRALEGMPDAYRQLDTAVLEALVLRGALGMSEDDIAHLRGLDYSKDFDDARDAVESGRADAGFFLRATPVEQVQAVAETGESMPPKSTYFFPKIPTGLVFNVLE